MSRYSSKLLSPLTLAVLLSATFLVPGLAQEPDRSARRPREVFPRAAEAPDEVLKIDTDLISLDVLAHNSEGRPVRSLRKEDFKLYVDDVAQPLAFFQVERRSGEPRPLAIVFALDISGSMSAVEMARLKSALNAFAARLAGHRALYAVMAFGMNVRTLQKFTPDPDKLDRAFERISREPAGLSTHTYDAIDEAIRLLVRSAPRTRESRLMKRAVLVVTDGFPVGDTVSATTVIELSLIHI